jgi:microcystin-dependent protein
MAETLTANYGWTKPDPGASPNTWGATQNASLDKVDAQVFVNQQGLTPIGGIIMFGGLAPPAANWLICDGRSLSTAAPYDKLFAAIAYAFGGSGANFSLPSLVQKFPLGAGLNPLGSGGGAFPVTLATANLPSHAHTITDVAHTHTATQPAHVHPDPGHGHPGSTAAETGQHSHGTNLMRFIGAGGTLGVGATPGNVSDGNTDPSNAPGIAVNIAAAATGLQAAGADAITVTASGSLIYGTNNTGSGTPFNVVPPFVAINFIIRFA